MKNTDNYFNHIVICSSFEPKFSTRLKHLIDGLLLRFRKLHFVEVIVTTKCNLRCRSCSNLIPEIQHKAEDVPFASFKRDFDLLMANFSHIYNVQIHGGEPLLHPEIDQILAYVLTYKRKISLITIVTNGTVIPSQKLLDVISNRGVLIRASYYKLNEGLREKLKTICENNHISIRQFEARKWHVFKNPEKENCTVSELKMRFKQCPANMCPSCKNGKMYLCSRLANIVTLKDGIEDDGIELSFSSKKGAVRFLQKDYSINCQYCHIVKGVFCEAAEQQI